MAHNLDASITSLETAVKDGTKDLEEKLKAEKQRIYHLKEEYNMLQKEIEKMDNATSKLDEQTREVYKRFTSTREKCNSLKRFKQCIENHKIELQANLQRKIEKIIEEESQYNQVLDMYREKWYNYQKIYEQHPLIPKVSKVKKQMEEKKALLRDLESQLKQLENERFRIKCDTKKFDKEGNSTIYAKLTKFILELAKIKVEAINNEKRITEVHNEIKELNSITTKMEISELLSTVGNSKQTETVQSRRDDIKKIPPPKVLPFQAPKFKFYVPPMSLISVTTTKPMTSSEYNITPPQIHYSSTPNDKKICTYKEYVQTRTEDTDLYKTPEKSSAKLQTTYSSPNSYTPTKISFSAPSSKSPGFMYQSRLMFTSNDSGRTVTNDTNFSPPFTSFQSNYFRNESATPLQTQSSELMINSNNNQPVTQSFFSQFSNSYNSPTPVSNVSALSLFGNPGNSGIVSEVSNFDFQFNSPNESISPNRDSFQFNF